MFWCCCDFIIEIADEPPTTDDPDLIQHEIRCCIEPIFFTRLYLVVPFFLMFTKLGREWYDENEVSSKSLIDDENRSDIGRFFRHFWSDIFSDFTEPKLSPFTHYRGRIDTFESLLFLIPVIKILWHIFREKEIMRWILSKISLSPKPFFPFFPEQNLLIFRDCAIYDLPYRNIFI